MEPAPTDEFVAVRREEIARKDEELARLRAEVAMLRAQVRTRAWREAIAAAWEETLAHHRSTLTRRCS